MYANLDIALKAIPHGLREPLIQTFEEGLSEYRAGRWESVGLKAGKLCEIVYSIIAGHLDGSFPASPSKPTNMVDACTKLEKTNSSQKRSLRIQIPRLLIAIYELRNNRDIGHVGSDVDPNHMDAELFLRSMKWIIAELVRVFGKIDIDAARALIESITERSHPIVWEGNGIKRVLKASLPTRDKVLILIYLAPKGVSAKDLAIWTDYENLSRFRNTVLKELDKNAFVHFDKATDIVLILPPGIRYVETAGILT